MRKVSRRTFVAGVAGAATVSALPFSIWGGRQAKAQQYKPLTRYDISTPEGEAMLKKYAQALTKMMNTTEYPEKDPSSWLFQWYTHALPLPLNAEVDRVYGPIPPADPTEPGRLLALETWNTCRAHGMTNLPQDEDDFLNWHRMFLYYHEQIIRTVLGDETFTLPYWDYTTEGKRSIPEQFRMENDADYGVLFRPNRNPGVNAGQPIDQNAPGAINLDSLEAATYQDTNAAQGFNSALDFGLHGAIHVRVGNVTNMGVVPWAARDPIFWMHHCNIDRLWASWNKGGRPNPGGDWLTHSFVFADENGARVTPVTQDFVDTETIADGPYNYDKYEPVPALEAQPAGAVLMAAAPAMIIAEQAQPGPIVLSKTGEAEVRLAPAAVPLGAHLMAGEASGRVHLLLQDVKTDVQPGILYNVYLDSAAGEAAAASEPIGTINFFGAEDHSPEHGAATRPLRFYSFDVTDAVTAAGAGDADGAPTVRIAPVGTPAADATPVIGAISLIR